MTYSEVLSQARRYSRVSSVAVSDDQAYLLLGDSIIEMGVDVNGFPKEDFLTIKAEFDLRTNMAFRLTVAGGSNDIAATDIAVTDADADDQTGAQVATELQAQIVAAGAADVTVSWDDTNLRFTITDAGATAITVEPPSSEAYIDYTEELFGTTGTQDGTWQGNFPEDCTLKADLPSDQIWIEYVEWGKRTLRPADQQATLSPESSGDPWCYYVRGAEIYLHPTPSSRELFYVRYRYVPAREANPSDQTDIATAVPTQYQTALVYFLASKLAMEQQDYEVSDRMYGQYVTVRNRYRAHVANQNASIQPQLYYPQLPRVIQS